MSLHGLLLIDKPVGITSHDVVGKARRLFKMRAIGHAGTLDPLASGLLVLLLGEATKLSDYIMDGQKHYDVGLEFGRESDTLDITGELTEKREVSLDPELVAAEIRKLQGSLELPVPVFSAVKTQGKKLYERARAGEEVKPPIRTMQFDRAEPVMIEGDRARASLECEKGGYVRSWVSELGKQLGCGALMTELRRTASSPYSVEQTIGLDDLEKKLTGLANMIGVDDLLGSSFVPLSRALPGWKALTVKDKDERLVTNGQVPNEVKRRLIPELKEAMSQDKTIGIKVISGTSGNLLSLIVAQPNKGLKIRRVFNLTNPS